MPTGGRNEEADVRWPCFILADCCRGATRRSPEDSAPSCRTVGSRLGSERPFGRGRYKAVPLICWDTLGETRVERRTRSVSRYRRGPIISRMPLCEERRFARTAGDGWWFTCRDKGGGMLSKSPGSEARIRACLHRDERGTEDIAPLQGRGGRSGKRDCPAPGLGWLLLPT